MKEGSRQKWPSSFVSFYNNCSYKASIVANIITTFIILEEEKLSLKIAAFELKKNKNYTEDEIC